MSVMIKGWLWFVFCVIVNNKFYLFLKLYIYWGNGI